MKTKKPKDPACVAHTLRWCNRMRAKYGPHKKPLKRLPKGIPCDPYTCPCGKATGLSVGGLHASFFVSGLIFRQRIVLPTSVRTFVRLFDQWMIPQYIEKPTLDRYHNS